MRARALLSTVPCNWVSCRQLPASTEEYCQGCCGWVSPRRVTATPSAGPGDGGGAVCFPLQPKPGRRANDKSFVQSLLKVVKYVTPFYESWLVSERRKSHHEWHERDLGVRAVVRVRSHPHLGGQCARGRRQRRRQTETQTQTQRAHEMESVARPLSTSQTLPRLHGLSDS